MNVTKSCFFRLYFFAIFTNITHSDDKTNRCTFATPNKPIGYYIYSTGHAEVTPYTYFQHEDRNICNNHCRVTDKCFATSFDRNSNCSFYKTNSFSIDTVSPNGIQYSIWTLCNMSDGEQPDDGRCRGLWVFHIDQYLYVRSYANIGINDTDIDFCQNSCLSDSLCGFVNFRDSTKNCELVPKWPYSSINSTIRIGVKVSHWTCVDNIIERITVSRQTFKPSDEKCTGYWTISRRNRRVKGGNITGVFFQTQIYKQCLNECNQYANCRTALYNITYSICVFIDVSDTQTVLPNNETRFIAFEWTCVKNDSHNPYKNEDEKRYESLGMRCYQIKNNTRLFIGEDQCGKHPKLSSFVQCDQVTSTHESIQWDIRQSCLVNQTYWSFPAQVVQMNVSGWMNLTKIYTGIQQYWLAYSDDEKLREVDHMVCRSFNVSRPLERRKKINILSREQWKALPPLHTLPRYPEKPIYIDISASQSPYHSCKTRAACSDKLRALQVLAFNGAGNTPGFSDIPYNFMIDESGNIYECRGWNNQCKAVKGMNDRTLCIAYIGWFRDELPKEGFLNSLKKLIEYSVHEGHVDKNYTLYVQQDLASSWVHQNLVIVIKNWYRYRGFIPEDCRNYSFFIIFLNAFAVLLMSLLLHLFYSLNSFAKVCNRCALLHSGQVFFREVFPLESEGDWLDSTETLPKTYSKYCLIHQKSSFISSNNQSRIVKLVKIWFLNQFLETVHSRLNPNSFANYLNSLSDVIDYSLIYRIDLMRETDLPNFEDIILCVKDESGLNLFQRLVKTRRCICYYFQADHVDLSAISKDIRAIE